MATADVGNLVGTVPVSKGGTGNTTIAARSIFLANALDTLTTLTPGAGQSIRINAGNSAWEAYTPSSATGDVTAAGNNTFTGLNTFQGTSSVLSSKFFNALEQVTVSATAATGTINYDITTQSVLYYTTNASANWTVNFRASSGTSLNTAMATGESITVAFLVTQGGTAYYNNVVQVDGNTITPKWQGGTAPTSGNASSIDAYVYTIVKTGSAAFTIFASQTKFA